MAENCRKDLPSVTRHSTRRLGESRIEGQMGPSSGDSNCQMVMSLPLAGVARSVLVHRATCTSSNAIHVLVAFGGILSKVNACQNIKFIITIDPLFKDM